MPSLIGNKPNQVSTNGDLGTLAFQDANAVNITGGQVAASAGTAALPTIGTTGDPDTGVFFPAANTVGVSTGGTERVRVASGGNVSIDTTSADLFSRGYGRILNINSASSSAIEMNSATGSSSVIDMGVNSTRSLAIITDGTTPKVASVGALPLAFETNASERMRIDSSGNLLVNQTSLAFAEKVGISFNGAAAQGMYLTDTSAASTSTMIGFKKNGVAVGTIATTNSGITVTGTNGIAFTATQSASSDANTLDDYEEGNWTPVVQGVTTAGTASYTSQIGRYVKIGRQVTITLDLNFSSATGTGIFQIAGLPFSSSSAHASTGSIMTSNLDWNTGTMVTLYKPGNSAVLEIYSSSDNGGWLQMNMDTAGEIIATVTYFTST